MSCIDAQPTYICRYCEIPGFPSCEEPVWDDLPTMTLVETQYGREVPELLTKAQSFWTDDALYFRFTGIDPHIVATMTQHDDPIYDEDVVEVFLSESGDLTRYKEFEVNPTNVQFDAEITNDLRGSTQLHLDWDALGWQTAVNYSPERSFIYYVWKIPFTNFTGGTPHVGDCWRMNCYRIDRGKDTPDVYLAWSPTGAINFHLPERFGYLRFAE